MLPMLMVDDVGGVCWFYLLWAVTVKLEGREKRTMRTVGR